MLLKKTADFLDGEGNDNNHDGVQNEAQRTRQARLNPKIEISLTFFVMLFMKFQFLDILFPGILFLNRWPPTGPPGVNFRLICINGIVFAVLVAVDRQTLGYLPSLCCANVSLEMEGDLLPGIQTVRIKRGRAGAGRS